MKYINFSEKSYCSKENYSFLSKMARHQSDFLNLDFGTPLYAFPKRPLWTNSNAR